MVRKRVKSWVSEAGDEGLSGYQLAVKERDTFLVSHFSSDLQYAYGSRVSANSAFNHIDSPMIRVHLAMAFSFLELSNPTSSKKRSQASGAVIVTGKEDRKKGFHQSHSWILCALWLWDFCTKHPPLSHDMRNQQNTLHLLHWRGRLVRQSGLHNLVKARWRWWQMVHMWCFGQG